jgi:hypothetical protein
MASKATAGCPAEDCVDRFLVGPGVPGGITTGVASMTDVFSKVKRGQNRHVVLK